MKQNILSGLAFILLLVVLTISIRSNAIDPPSRDDGNLPALYQTMRYCGSTLTYACTTKTLAEKCRRYKCITTY